jgi:RHS repeat-associated protein
MSLVASAFEIDGGPIAWTLAEDTYTLKSQNPLVAGEHTLRVAPESAFDLAGLGVAELFEQTFTVEDQPAVTTAAPEKNLDPLRDLIFRLPDGNYVPASALPSRRTFHGRPLDPETGLLYFRHRYYDPQLGRFITPDPMGFVDGPSMYQFARNNPLDFADPTGESATLIGGLVGGVGGLAYAGYRSLRFGEGYRWNYAVQGAVAGAAVGFGIDTLGTGAGLSAAVIGGTAIGAGLGGAAGSIASDGSYTGFGRGAAKGGLLGGIGGASAFALTAAGASGLTAFAGGFAADTYAGVGIDFAFGDCPTLSGCFGTNAAGSLLGTGIGHGIARSVGFFGRVPRSVTLDPTTIRFSQSNVRSTLPEITQSMKAKGWQGGPIDVVRMPDGTLVAVDNTRLAAASLTDTPVQAVVREFGETFPAARAGGNLQGATWGKAVLNRIAGQKPAWQRLYKQGSPFTGVHPSTPGFSP